jgi:hypothetical protein
MGFLATRSDVNFAGSWALPECAMRVEIIGSISSEVSRICRQGSVLRVEAKVFLRIGAKAASWTLTMPH